MLPGNRGKVRIGIRLKKNQASCVILQENRGKVGPGIRLKSEEPGV